MKAILLFFFFIFLIHWAQGQTQWYKYDSVQKKYIKIIGDDTTIIRSPSGDETFIHITDKSSPVFDGDWKNFIQENLIYPEAARTSRLEGYVDLVASVKKDGVPYNIAIIYSTSGIFDDEAKRLMQLTRWKIDDRISADGFRQRIEFKLR